MFVQVVAVHNCWGIEMYYCWRMSNVQTDAKYSKLYIWRMFRLRQFSGNWIIMVVLSVPQQIKPGSVFNGLEVMHSEACQVWQVCDVVTDTFLQTTRTTHSPIC